MTPLIFASAMALFRATLSSSDPLFPAEGPGGGPVPVNGVWAGLPSDCATPTSLDLSTWPKCATPVGFLDGVIAVLQKPAPGKSAPSDQYYAIARTKFWSIKPAAPDAPAIVQVDIPILFASSTIYIAVLPDVVDKRGGFVSAKGWPIGCPATPMVGVTLEGGHCIATTAGGVRAAAVLQPDATRTYRLVRITASASSDKPPVAQIQPPAAMPDAAAPTAVMPPSTPPTAAPGDVTQTPLPPPSPPAPNPPG